MYLLVLKIVIIASKQTKPVVISTKSTDLINRRIAIRAGKRQSVTKAIARFDKDQDTLSIDDCSFYLDKVLSLKSELNDLDNLIDCEMLNTD